MTEDRRITPGPWQVIETRHRHHHGGEHVEYRIFTAWDHPQMKGPIGVVNGSVGIGAEKGGRPIHFVSMTKADATFIAAAPRTLVALQELHGLLALVCAEFADPPPGALDKLENARRAIAEATATQEWAS